jgi:ribosomal protein L19E
MPKKKQCERLTAAPKFESKTDHQGKGKRKGWHEDGMPNEAGWASCCFYGG